MSSSDHLGEVKFPVRASWIAIAVVVGLSIAFYWESRSVKETIVFLAAASAAAGAILAAFYSARGLGITAAIAARAASAEDDQQAYAARMRSMGYGERWNDPSMFHVRDVVRELFDRAQDAQRFKEHVTEKKTNVTHFLNFLEEIAIAVNTGDSDETTLKRMFRGVVIDAWTKLGPWIEEQRRERNRPRGWIEMQELARRWAA